MSFRRSLIVLATAALIGAAGLTAQSSAQGGVCSPSTPQYCPPPAVHTGPAKHVTSTSATLTGTVNPNGSATTCYFEYGTTTHYGSTTPPQNVGSGSRTVKVSATVTGLAPNTVYHYQLVCSNLGGHASGGDKKFKTHPTPKKPGGVKTGPAKHVRNTSATLTGTVNPEGSSTSCFFEYGRTKSYGSTTPTQSVGSGTKPVTLQTTVKNLSPGTRYHYQLVCTNAAGRKTGGDRHFTTRNQIGFRGSKTIRVSRNGNFTVLLHCGGNRPCVGVLSFTGWKGISLAPSVHYSIAPHKTQAVQMTLTPSARRQLRHRHHLKGRLRAQDGDGSAAHRRVTLRRGSSVHRKHSPIFTG